MAGISQLSSEKCIRWVARLPPDDNTPSISPKFRVQGSEWHLELRPDFITFSLDYYYYVVLSRKNGKSGKRKKKKLKKSFKVSTYVQKDDQILFPDIELVKEAEQPIFQFSGNVLEERFPDIGDDGEIVIVCIFHLPESDVSCQKEKRPEDKCTEAHFDAFCDLDRLSLDLCNRLSNEEFEPDVVARCGDRTTHMAILAARSEAFAAMFQDKMAQSEPGAVEIPDGDVSGFELFLKFLNSGNVQFLSEDSACRFYSAGERYIIPSLKKVCSDFLVKNLNLKNCLRFLAMSEKHGDYSLKEAAVNFVSEHLEGLQREEWSSFIDECPKLAMKVYKKCCEGTLKKQVSDTKN